MSSTDKIKQSLLDALVKDEDDSLTRLALADRLDELGEHEEADRMRAWPLAKKWMVKWVESINYPDEWDEETGDVLPNSPRTGPHSYQDAIEAGHRAVSGEGYCWGTDDGSSYFWDNGRSGREEWFRHWSILTGVPVPEEVVERPPFRCAC